MAERELQRAHEHFGVGSVTELAGDPIRMGDHGYLTRQERLAIACDALAHVVAPAAATLLGVEARASRAVGRAE